MIFATPYLSQKVFTLVEKLAKEYIVSSFPFIAL